MNLVSWWASFGLNWAQYSVSFFNFLLLLWLGLTVFLNARGRSWGTILASCGLLTGALFFALHTVALDFSLDTLLETSPLWWAILSAPLVALPFGWLVLMCWYGGFWESRGNGLQKRLAVPLLVAGIWGAFLVALALWKFPQGATMPFGVRTDGNDAQFWSLRWMVLLYPPFLLLCTATALFALVFPAPTASWSRDASRQRARPYLLASSGWQLFISLGVALALWKVGAGTLLQGDNALYNLTGMVATWVDGADLVLQMGIAGAVLLLGKAIVSFEIFTGKLLPRRGFWRQWRAVVALAALYSVVVAGAWGLNWPPIFPLLLSMLGLGSFLAVFSWRSFRDRENELARLHSFVSSGHLLQGLLAGDESAAARAVDEPLRVLCEQLLGAGRAALVAGPKLAPLFGPPRAFPHHLPPQNDWTTLARETEIVRALPDEASMDYAVPLGENGRLGALLLGPRRDGSLYTLEEIELARATGEHLLDSGAAATLAARLGALQRQKIAEIATLDRAARRRLHDEILPLLHGALLDWKADEGAARGSIVAAHREISNLLREMPGASPLSQKSVLEALKSEIEGEMSGKFDAVRWKIAPSADIEAGQLPEMAAQTLFFAARESLRNAARHGRGNDATRVLQLEISASCDARFWLEISDNGVGSNAVLRSQTGGSGSGLGLHAALLAVVGGSLEIESDEKGTRVRLGVAVGSD